MALVTLACGPEFGSAERLVRWFDPDGRPAAGANLARWGAAASVFVRSNSGSMRQ